MPVTISVKSIIPHKLKQNSQLVKFFSALGSSSTFDRAKILELLKSKGITYQRLAQLLTKPNLSGKSGNLLIEALLQELGATNLQPYKKISGNESARATVGNLTLERSGSGEIYAHINGKKLRVTGRLKKWIDSQMRLKGIGDGRITAKELKRAATVITTFMANYGYTLQEAFNMYNDPTVVMVERDQSAVTAARFALTKRLGGDAKKFSSAKEIKTALRGCPQSVLADVAKNCGSSSTAPIVAQHIMRQVLTNESLTISTVLGWFSIQKSQPPAVRDSSRSIVPKVRVSPPPPTVTPPATRSPIINPPKSGSGPLRTLTDLPPDIAFDRDLPLSPAPAPVKVARGPAKKVPPPKIFTRIRKLFNRAIGSMSRAIRSIVKRPQPTPRPTSKPAPVVELVEPYTPPKPTIVTLPQEPPTPVQPTKPREVVRRPAARKLRMPAKALADVQNWVQRYLWRNRAKVGNISTIQFNIAFKNNSPKSIVITSPNIPVRVKRMIRSAFASYVQFAGLSGDAFKGSGNNTYKGVTVSALTFANIKPSQIADRKSVGRTYRSISKAQVIAARKILVPGKREIVNQQLEKMRRAKVLLHRGTTQSELLRARTLISEVMTVLRGIKEPRRPEPAPRPARSSGRLADLSYRSGGPGMMGPGRSRRNILRSGLGSRLGTIGTGAGRIPTRTRMSRPAVKMRIKTRSPRIEVTRPLRKRYKALASGIINKGFYGAIQYLRRLQVSGIAGAYSIRLKLTVTETSGRRGVSYSIDVDGPAAGKRKIKEQVLRALNNSRVKKLFSRLAKGEHEHSLTVRYTN